ncbi:MAG TPA: beta-propeller fold lactonase family protein [Thermoanaerobaculia bacterium]|nr:beta-propeller fold lactonase family protein [Thermoanaerobaculia bacterium]
MRETIAAFLLLLSGAAAAAPAPAPRSSDRIVILNKSDDTATIVEAVTGKSVATIPVGHGPHEAAVLADGRTCAVSDYGDREKPGRTITLLDVEKGTKIGAIELPSGARPHGLAPLPDGRLLVTAEGLKELLVVDPKARRVEQQIPTFQDVSHMVVSTPDGARAFVANIGSGSVTVVEGRKAIRQIPTGKGAEGIAITPDGRQVWVANREADTVSVIDARSLEVIGEVAAAKFPIRVKITSDGRRALVSCASSGEVAIFDATTRRPIGRIAIAATPEGGATHVSSSPGERPEIVGLLVAPDNRRAWVAAAGADFVAALDLEKLAVVGRLVAGHGPDGMAGAFR